MKKFDRKSLITLLVVVVVLIIGLYPNKDILSYLIYSKIAQEAFLSHNYTKAEKLYIKLMALSDNSNGRIQPDYSNFVTLGTIYSEDGRYSEAELLYKKALSIHQKYDSHNNKTKADILYNLGSLYLESGKYNEAESALTQSLLISQKILGANKEQYINILGNLGTLYIEQKKYNKAEILFNSILKICQKSKCTKNNQAHAFDNLGIIYCSMKNYNNAKNSFRQSLEIYKSAKNEKGNAVALNNLANIYWVEGKQQEALIMTKNALELSEKASGNNSAETISIKSSLIKKQEFLKLIKEGK